jgi:CTP:molybdopterin cytidylyltransferase MocA
MNMLAGVVLAAGQSSRMGSPKALLKIGPDYFLDRIIRSLRAVADGHTIVTIARNGLKNLADIDLSDCVLLTNTGSAAEGQIGSIRTAIRWLVNRPVEMAMIWPVDHPGVLETTARSLVSASLRSRFPIVVPLCRGRRGHPAVFSRAVFGELLSADADGGAQVVVRRDEARVLQLEVGDPGVLDDVDTPDDYARLRARSAPGSFL